MHAHIVMRAVNVGTSPLGELNVSQLQELQAQVKDFAVACK